MKKNEKHNGKTTLMKLFAFNQSKRNMQTSIRQEIPQGTFNSFTSGFLTKNRSADFLGEAICKVKEWFGQRS